MLKIFASLGLWHLFFYFHHQKGSSKCGSRGGTGGPDPPGKSQVIWVSKRNQQLDPPLENV